MSSPPVHFGVLLDIFSDPENGGDMFSETSSLFGTRRLHNPKDFYIYCDPCENLITKIKCLLFSKRPDEADCVSR
jgi:hypothetical protein